MKTLHIIRGAPGASKSYLANCISAQNGAVICEADTFMVNDKGQYEFNPKRLYECHQKCKDKAKNAILKGDNVICSNTNIKRKEFEEIVVFAKEKGYKVQEIAILSSDFESVHNVPLDKVQKMHEGLIQSIRSEKCTQKENI